MAKQLRSRARASFRSVLLSAVAAMALLVPSAAGAAQPPIKLGFGICLTGALAGNGKAALLSMQMWADDVNKRGGLLGRPVELVYYDDQTKPAAVPAIYAKLLDVDKVASSSRGTART